MEDNFLDEYSKGIFGELGFNLDSSEQSTRLLEAVNKRILARVFLEMVTFLTPEQAAALSAEMDKEENKDNNEKMISLLRDSIPDFPIRMAKVLTDVRGELLEDLKALVA